MSHNLGVFFFSFMQEVTIKIRVYFIAGRNDVIKNYGKKKEKVERLNLDNGIYANMSS